MNILTILYLLTFVFCARSGNLPSQPDCDGPTCFNICCPYQDWVCCQDFDVESKNQDGIYCAPTLEECPGLHTELQEDKVVEDECEFFKCFEICCPYEDWVCCDDVKNDDGIYCVPTLDDCP